MSLPSLPEPRHELGDGSAGAPHGAVACVEIGGGGVQTVILGDGEPIYREGARPPADLPLLIAVPGLLDGHIVVAASNLGWYHADPVEMLGLSGPAALVRGDAEAAALGEAALRGGDALNGLVYVGLGTGVGGAVVLDGRVAADNLFGHMPGFGDVECSCGQTGCLETVAAGWALPYPVLSETVSDIARAVARAVTAEPLATPGLVVLAGGLVRRHPELVTQVAAELPDRVIEPSAAPAQAKSAAPWGLAHAFAAADAAA